MDETRPDDARRDHEPPPANTLIIEPVFNRVGEIGPDEILVGIFNPGLINPSTGEPFIDADEPGEAVTFPAGFPADAINVDVLRFANNTGFDIAGLRLSIVGSAVEPVPFSFLVTRDPDFAAYFGDVDGDGRVGVSDIFSTIEVSEDRKTITFSDGLIPVGGRFTDYIFSETTTGEPKLAAVEAEFSAAPAAAAPATAPADWLCT